MPITRLLRLFNCHLSKAYQNTCGRGNIWLPATRLCTVDVTPGSYGDTLTERQEANGIYQGQQFGWDEVDHRASRLTSNNEGMPDIDFVSSFKCF